MQTSDSTNPTLTIEDTDKAYNKGFSDGYAKGCETAKELNQAYFQSGYFRGRIDTLEEERQVEKHTSQFIVWFKPLGKMRYETIMEREIVKALCHTYNLDLAQARAVVETDVKWVQAGRPLILHKAVELYVAIQEQGIEVKLKRA